jgi:hypothetical protein
MVDKVLLQLCYTIFHLSFNAVPSYAFPSAIKYQTYVGALNFKTVLSKAFFKSQSSCYRKYREATVRQRSIG